MNCRVRTGGVTVAARPGGLPPPLGPLADRLGDRDHAGWWWAPLAGWWWASLALRSARCLCLGRTSTNARPRRTARGTEVHRWPRALRDQASRGRARL